MRKFLVMNIRNVMVGAASMAALSCIHTGSQHESSSYSGDSSPSAPAGRAYALRQCVRRHMEHIIGDYREAFGVHTRGPIEILYTAVDSPFVALYGNTNGRRVISLDTADVGGENCPRILRHETAHDAANSIASALNRGRFPRLSLLQREHMTSYDYAEVLVSEGIAEFMEGRASPEDTAVAWPRTLEEFDSATIDRIYSLARKLVSPIMARSGPRSAWYMIERPPYDTLLYRPEDWRRMIENNVRRDRLRVMHDYSTQENERRWWDVLDCADRESTDGTRSFSACNPTRRRIVRGLQRKSRIQRRNARVRKAAS